MIETFLRAFDSEWLKRKRSLAAWLVIGGSIFTPMIVVVARLVQHERLAALYAADGFWDRLWRNSWESMAIFFLPMAAILATSLVAQIEFTNNAWKQVHAMPLGLPTIYGSKFAVVVVMMVQFLVLFDIAIWLSAVVPWLLVEGVPWPKGPIPFARFLADDVLYFIDCLPILAAQYLLSVRFRNFLVPVGVGFLAWVGALGALPWKFAYVIPYTYCMLDYLRGDPTGKAAVPPGDFHWLALGYFLVFGMVGLAMFAMRKDKG